MLLDNRVEDQITTRRLRVVKYRGSAHGTNEYPFLIDAQGMSVLPVTSARLSQCVSNEIVSSGSPELDAMLGAGGFFRGPSILLSGVAGTGKTTLSAHFVGLDLQQHAKVGLLRFEAARPSLCGLEMYLARMHRDLDQFDPAAVVIDPIFAFRSQARKCMPPCCAG